MTPHVGTRWRKGPESLETVFHFLELFGVLVFVGFWGAVFICSSRDSIWCYSFCEHQDCTNSSHKQGKALTGHTDLAQLSITHFPPPRAPPPHNPSKSAPLEALWLRLNRIAAKKRAWGQGFGKHWRKHVKRCAASYHAQKHVEL